MLVKTELLSKIETDHNRINLESLADEYEMATSIDKITPKKTYLLNELLKKRCLLEILLIQNAAQLKYIISNWDQQEFHMLLSCLVITSIG